MRNLMITIASAILMLVILAAAKACMPTAEAEPALCRMPTPLVDPAADLKLHAERSIALASPKISDARKTVFTSLLVATAQRTFDSREHQKFWISQIGVESGYDGRARSAKGAVGLGQLMPKYRAAFGEKCGLSDVTEADLLDDATNLALSSCYFRQLIDDNGGDVSLAMVSYVSGPFSADIAKARAGKPTGTEATAYVKVIHQRKAQAEGK